MPHRICRDLNLGRSPSCADAINKASVVEYGDTSTIDAHTRSTFEAFGLQPPFDLSVNNL
jgi:hypothetical protein